MPILLAMPVGITNSGSSMISQIILFFASYFPLIVAGVSIIFLCFRIIPEVSAIAPFRRLAQRARDIGFVAVTTALTHEFAVLLKNHFQIDRPVAFTFDLVALIEKTDFGFPSGHAAVFSALAVALFFIHRKAGFVVGGAALIIGAARILAGVHTPLDILGGYILGTVVASLAWIVLERIDPPSSR